MKIWIVKVGQYKLLQKTTPMKIDFETIGYFDSEEKANNLASQWNIENRTANNFVKVEPINVK